MPVRASLFDRLQSLSDETRARILLLLQTHEFTVGEICQIVQMPQSTVSRHLGILGHEEWLTVRAEGRRRHYRLSPTLDEGARQLWTAVRDALSTAPVAQEDRLRSRSVLEARAERSRAFFSSEAGRWDHLRKEVFGDFAHLGLLPGLLQGSEMVGDLGCGTGHLTRLLAPFARGVIAVDRAKEMLEVARGRLLDLENVQLREGDLTGLPLDGGVLDVAVLALVLHYVVDLERALREVHRVLRPGGRVLLLDMLEHDREGFREEMGHVWLGFRPEALELLLEEVGFGAVNIVTLPPDPDAGGPRLFVLRANRGS